MKKVITFLIFLSFSSNSIFADPLAKRMNEIGFVEAKPPKIGSKEFFKLNYGEAFIVELNEELNEELNVRSPKKGEIYSSKVVFDTGGIKYLGIDKGEFGGGLYIDSFNKEKKPFFSGNINSLVPIDDDLYIIEGLAHMGFNGGSIHAIRNYKKLSKPERITLLPSAPSVVMLDKVYANKQTGIVIVGHDSFMILLPDRELIVLHHNTFWGSLYPSSLVKYKEHYVFGIRGGAVAISANFWSAQSQIRYFKPNK